MELKRQKVVEVECARERFNRTFMELKRTITTPTIIISDGLIVPLWN